MDHRQGLELPIGLIRVGTAHTSTGCSPGELLMGHKLITLLDRLHPD